MAICPTPLPCSHGLWINPEIDASLMKMKSKYDVGQPFYRTANSLKMVSGLDGY